MNILIVDDEAPARQRLRKLLGEFPEVQIVGECSNGFEALDSLPKTNPDLIFLDIQMPRMDGFAFLKSVPEEDCPLVVFITAFNEHAVKAFEVHAIDYILKPFRVERLKKSIDHAQTLLRLKSEAQERPKFESALQEIAQKVEYPERLAVRDGTRWFVLPVADIVYFQACGNYVEVHTLDKRCLLWRETMSRLETKLDPRFFFRASRSSFIHISHIREIHSEGKSGHTILMTTGDTVHLTNPLEALQTKLIT